MYTRDWWFFVAMGACFVLFAKPYGRALGFGLEGRWTPEQRERDAKCHTLVARVFRGGLVVYSIWRLLR
jgi:hypothetical protein